MSSEVPKGWAAQQLGQVVRVVTGKTPSTKDDRFWNGKVPFVTPSDIGDSPWCDTVERHLSTLGASTVSTAPAGAVLFTCIASIGKSCILSERSAFNQQINACIPGPSTDSYFLYSQLQAMGDEIRQLAGTTAVPIINKSTFSTIPIWLPPLDEQRRIAEVLRSVDEAIAAAENAVVQANTALHLNAEKLLVHDLTETANERRLVDLIASLDAGVSVNSEGRPAADGEIGILKTSCVSGGYFDPDENKVVLPDEVARTRVQPTANSIIISRMNTLDLVGANAFVAEDCPDLYLPDRLWLLKTKPNIMCRWLAFYMKTVRFRAQIVDIASGTSGSMKNISKARLSDIAMHVPEYTEQERAVDILTAMESAMLSAQAVARSYREMRQSLMSDLLSGRVRVPA
ncbi:restriction endonuclease subunit S [Mesorhizobium koreense]|uniref:restriction endonuclease subunit S n=1 Tax=Mesorhizobium koreense TaxID=3074855 RepID=UPI00287BC9F7|nr:restriction endonuclease subunit S [Mesorhizobium sp. WR6]